MPTTTYRFKRWRKRTIVFGAMFIVLGLLQLQQLAYRFPGMDPSWTDAQVENLSFSIVSLILLLVCVLGIMHFLKPGGAKREFIRLDGEGLTYGNLFGAHRWTWRDLSAFAVSRRTKGDYIITFAVPGKLGWTLNQTDTKALIEDIYDTPVGDIAAKLNEYRDRALELPADA